MQYALRSEWLHARGLYLLFISQRTVASIFGVLYRLDLHNVGILTVYINNIIAGSSHFDMKK